MAADRLLKAIESILKNDSGEFIHEGLDSYVGWKLFELSANVDLDDEFKKQLVYFSGIFSLKLDNSNNKNPFKERWRNNSNRTFSIDDVSENLGELTAYIAKNVSNEILSARLFDVLWVTKFGINPKHYAIAAVNEYCKISEYKQFLNEIFSFHERAANLILKLNIEEQKITLTETIKSFLIEKNKNYSHLKYLELLYMLSEEDEYLLSVADSFDFSSDNKNYEFERSVISFKIKIFRSRKDTAAVMECENRIVESHLNQANAASQQMVKAKFLNLAARKIRTISPFDRAKYDAILKELQIVHRLSLDEFAEFSIPTEGDELDAFKKEIDELKKHVRDDNPATALVKACFSLPILTRNLVSPETQEFFIHKLFSKNFVDAEGLSVAAVDGADEESSAYRNASTIWANFHAHQIQAIFDQINSDHFYQKWFIEQMLKDCVLCQEYSRGLVAQGIIFGMSGEYSLALHILIPAFEEGLRGIFRDRNELHIKIDNKTGMQENIQLETLIDRAQDLDFLDENISFNLNCFLIKKTGSYLRHKVAHGMLVDNHNYSPDCIYTFWFLLRLYVQSTVTGGKLH